MLMIIFHFNYLPPHLILVLIFAPLFLFSFLFLFFDPYRGMLFAVDPKATLNLIIDDAAQHHIPNICLSRSLCQMVLSKWGHMFFVKDRRIHPLQLRVGIPQSSCLHSFTQLNPKALGSLSWLLCFFGSRHILHAYLFTLYLRVPLVPAAAAAAVLIPPHRYKIALRIWGWWL